MRLFVLYVRYLVGKQKDEKTPLKADYLCPAEKNVCQVPKKVYLRNELINLRSTLLNIFAFITQISSLKGHFITNSSSLFVTGMPENQSRIN